MHIMRNLWAQLSFSMESRDSSNSEEREDDGSANIQYTETWTSDLSAITLDNISNFISDHYVYPSI